MKYIDNKITQSHGSQLQGGVTWLTLFASTATLVCCALPIILVSIGMGATVAALTQNMPFLVTLSLHKLWVFSGSALLLVISGWLMFRPGRTCPDDPALAALCNRSHKWNQRIFWIAVVLWCIGFFAAFLALPLRIWLDS